MHHHCPCYLFQLYKVANMTLFLLLLGRKSMLYIINHVRNITIW
nr:MAG TPA: hypothetical protein [Caudoviricetes sp.]